MPTFSTFAAGAGAAATEVYRYNREAYEFDKSQRFELEELRLKMQVERFGLFREDIRDLVELTIGKMDLYHLIGAILLKMCIKFFCEGLVWLAVPPYLLTLYLLTLTCAFTYLLLAVWLAMHASLTSHSLGTRLLTRYVRLPIPGDAQISALNARYADFEKEGRQMFRVPFLRPPNEWTSRTAHDESGGSKQQQPGDANKCGALTAELDLLGQGYFNLSDDQEAELVHGVDFRLEQHIQLFRRLQAKWQCFDAYARVCMALGVRQLLQAMSYFLIGVCMVDNNMPAIGLAVIIAFQTLGVGVMSMDVFGMTCGTGYDLQLLGAMPALFAFLAITPRYAPRGEETGLLLEDNTYKLAVLVYPFEMIWFEFLLYVSTPSRDEMQLPRHFRSVLFMDVFGDSDDPSEIDFQSGLHKLTGEELNLVERRIKVAEDALHVAQAGLRRWEAAQRALPEADGTQLRSLRSSLDAWVRELQEELDRRSLQRLPASVLRPRTWIELTQSERDADPFAGLLVGPLAHTVGMGLSADYYYSLEANTYLQAPPPGSRTLPLDQVAEFVDEFEQAVASVYLMARDVSKLHVNPQRARAGSNASSIGPAGSLPSNASSFSSAASEVPAKKPHDRMPWRVMRNVTRAVQFIWLVMGIASGLREWGVWKVDYAVSNIEEEGRRLQLRFTWHDEDPPLLWPLPPAPLSVEWPYGRFYFRPRALACAGAESSSASSPGGLAARLLVGGASAIYGSVSATDPQTGLMRPGNSSQPVRFQQLQHLGVLPVPQDFIFLCGLAPGLLLASGSSSGCVLGSLEAESVSLWSWGPQQAIHKLASVPLATAGGRSHWRKVAGAFVDCDDGEGGWLGSPEVNGSTCLLLAGWAQGEDIQLATAYHSGNDPSAGWSPALLVASMPMRACSADICDTSPRAARDKVSALHLDAASKRMWFLTETGTLHVRHPFRQPGLSQSWRLSLPSDFRLTALCEGAAQREGGEKVPDAAELFMVGRGAAAGARVPSGPVLLKAQPYLGVLSDRGAERG